MEFVMRPSLVPVVILATVALSSSNVLPILATVELPDTLGRDRRNDDNILSNKLDVSNIVNSIFNDVPYDTSEIERIQKKTDRFGRRNNKGKSYFDYIVDKDDNYDDEGFRKEQWHNYPRQLDRLHRYLFEHRTEKQSDTDDDSTNYNKPDDGPTANKDTTTNELLLYTNPGANNIYEAVIAATNPLLVLKVHLACLEGMNNKETKYYHSNSLQDEPINDSHNGGDTSLINDINPAVKVKREETSAQDAEVSDDNIKEKSVNKRLFSLWSRLQSLSHKGHELPHRRHIHAFYGLPDNDAGGGLTAETRATLMRPPGSPLRWG